MCRGKISCAEATVKLTMAKNIRKNKECDFKRVLFLLHLCGLNLRKIIHFVVFLITRVAQFHFIFNFDKLSCRVFLDKFLPLNSEGKGFCFRTLQKENPYNQVLSKGEIAQFTLSIFLQYFCEH